MSRFSSKICNGVAKQRRSTEPVMMNAEAVHAVPSRQCRLSVQHLGIVEIVETKFAGKMRLIMPAKPRGRLGDVGHSVNPLPHHMTFLGLGGTGEIVGDHADRIFIKTE